MNTCPQLARRASVNESSELDRLELNVTMNCPQISPETRLARSGKKVGVGEVRKGIAYIANFSKTVDKSSSAEKSSSPTECESASSSTEMMKREQPHQGSQLRPRKTLSSLADSEATGRVASARATGTPPVNEIAIHTTCAPSFGVDEIYYKEQNASKLATREEAKKAAPRENPRLDDDALSAGSDVSDSIDLDTLAPEEVSQAFFEYLPEEGCISVEFHSSADFISLSENDHSTTSADRNHDHHICNNNVAETDAGCYQKEDRSSHPERCGSWGAASEISKQEEPSYWNNDFEITGGNSLDHEMEITIVEVTHPSRRSSLPCRPFISDMSGYVELEKPKQVEPVTKKSQTGKPPKQGKKALITKKGKAVAKTKDQDAGTNEAQPAKMSQVTAPLVKVSRRKTYCGTSSEWEKPSWTQQIVLKPTKHGKVARQGVTLALPVTNIMSAVQKEEPKLGWKKPEWATSGPRLRPIDQSGPSEKRESPSRSKPDWARDAGLKPTCAGIRMVEKGNLEKPITFPAGKDW